MGSNAEKRRAQKKAERKKRLTKERNLRANGARTRYTLECRLSKNQQWKPMKHFRDQAAVQRHIDETEAIRKRGDTDIIEGRVIDNIGLGRIVARIPGYTVMKGITMNQAAQDDIASRVAEVASIKNSQKEVENDE